MGIEGGRSAAERFSERSMRGGGIMELILTGAERTILRETMEKAIDDLLMEIAHTDKRKMRDQLKEREEVMRGILARLSAGERAA